MKLRLGTRGSRLALVQARRSRRRCAALGVEVEIVPIRTSGDRLAQVALADFGGKALFVKEIEEALLERRVDVGRAQPEGHARRAARRARAGRVSAARGPARRPRDARRGHARGPARQARGRHVEPEAPGAAARPAAGSARRADPGQRGHAARQARGRRATTRSSSRRPAWTGSGCRAGHAVALSVDEFLPAVGAGHPGRRRRAASDARTLELLGSLDHTRHQDGGRSPSARSSGVLAPAATRRWRDTRALDGASALADRARRERRRPTVLRSAVSGPGSAARGARREARARSCSPGARRRCWRADEGRSAMSFEVAVGPAAGRAGRRGDARARAGRGLRDAPRGSGRHASCSSRPSSSSPPTRGSRWTRRSPARPSTGG